MAICNLPCGDQSITIFNYGAGIWGTPTRALFGDDEINTIIVICNGKELKEDSTLLGVNEAGCFYFDRDLKILYYSPPNFDDPLLFNWKFIKE